MKQALRVLSYNIHKGFSLDRRFVLSAIREAIQTTQADLIFLQEVIGENTKHSRDLKEWPVAPQFEFLAESLWPHFAYGKNAVYTEGHHGNAIMSRRPFRMYENIDISTNSLERRGLLHAALQAFEPGQPEVHLICLHLDLFEKGRAQQYEKICKRIKDHVPDGCPLIIAGDFNDWRENASEKLEKELGVREVFTTLKGRHAKSFPAWFPFLPLDRIYVRDVKPENAACFTKAPWSQLSDHGALLADLEILPRVKASST